jgi:hypothetical protein
MIRKLNDQEYKNLGTRTLHAFLFALNTTFNSAIGCTPFEAGHGLAKYPIGRKAFIYNKPPTQAETISRGRKAKHIDHYIGPGIITSHIGTRSMVRIRLNDRDFQRDAGMVLLQKPKEGDRDPTIEDRMVIGVQTFSDGIQLINPLQEREFIIVKDDPSAHD